MEPTAAHFATTSTRPSPPPPVRLSLAPYETVPGGFDGAWWPYSCDLTAELPPLLEAMDGVGTITRVTLGIDSWPDVPHQVAAGRHFVTVGWFVSGRDQHEMLLCSYHQGFRTLLVIPPVTTADTAAWLMNTPVPVDGSRTATQLLEIGEESVRSDTR
ncbi:hypothetical protein FBY35_3927 [Streptomyces sp. SLBN-118]|uniref:DUF5994 family protein n=1 Tax=Streptomyces sp. SLBN-118 TaxID=2768454 RepID=UPI0011699C2D|nr:DUF5994 family protein [Streptomyces sp. SLBN-118]TQK42511.1 hypothetical protein FBY35_3927 [Streptomyces sp. SLBN-118]